MIHSFIAFVFLFFLWLGPDKGGYYHECFLRGLPQLAETIRRSKANHKSADSTSTKIKSSCEGEPNFYAMPPLPGGGGVRSNNQDVRTKLQGGVESTTESSIEDAPFQGRSWIPCVGSTTAKNEQVPAATGTSFKQDKVPKTKLVDAATNWVLANTKGFLQGTKVPASASRNQPSQVPMTSLPVPFPNSRNPVVGAGDTGITTRQDPMKLLQRGSSSSSNTMDSFARPENQFNGFWNNPIFQDPPHPTMLCRSSSSSMASSSSSSNSSFLPQQQQQQQQAPTSAYSLSAILEPTPIAPTALLRVQSARSVNASSHPTLQDTTQGPESFYAAVGCMPSYANHGAVKDEEEEDSFAYLSRLLSKNMDDTGTALNLASLSSSKDHFF